MNQSKTLEYQGKAKIFYKVDDVIGIQCFKDDISAFNQKKTDKIIGKGTVNNHISAYFMKRLAEDNISNHFIKILSPQEQMVKRLQMIPLEIVVRNISAGTLSKRLCIETGLKLKNTILEFSYKKGPDDPLLNEAHILELELLNQTQINNIKNTSFEINRLLTKYLNEVEIELVDFKIEFGLHNGEIMLGDEISPDTCRLWDKAVTGNDRIMDKDTFRQSIGGTLEKYLLVAERLGIIDDFINNKN